MSRIEGSLAVFGGLVTNLFARLVLGIGGPSPLFGKTLPITFDCSKALKSDNPFEVEPWQVIVDGRRSRKECLVVTSMPLSENGERLTIFSGLHGAGTRAINFLFANPRILETLCRATHDKPAWQAIFEVEPIDKEFLKSIGDHRVREISNIDFRQPDKLIRDNLILSSTQADKLIKLISMLPQKIDPTDIACTSIVNLYNHRLWNRHSRANVVSAEIADHQYPELPSRRSEGGAASGPLSNEAKMNAVPPNQIARKRWGRPPCQRATRHLLDDCKSWSLSKILR
jgi:hypothetical protein